MSKWINLNLPFFSYDKDSFRGRNLNKPGTLIDTTEGIYLIGHINRLGGVCDDCMEFLDVTIVKRYKIINLEMPS